MFADILLVDLDRMMNSPWMSPDTDILDVFIHRGFGSDVNTVLVGGRVVMKERRITTIDEEALYREIRKAAAKGISPQQRKYAEQLQYLKPYYQKWYNNWLVSNSDSFYQVNSRF